MQVTGPLKSSEVDNAKLRDIPEEVFEAFNELIVKSWNGSIAVVRQDDVIARIMEKLDVSRHAIFGAHWLDVEPAYRKAGWSVLYDKPGYNEDYPATFEFRKARRA